MTKPKRKLIFCWPYVEWGGAQVYFMAIMKSAKSDWDVLAVLPKDSSPEVKGFLDQIGIPFETLDFKLDMSPAAGLLAKLKRQWNRVRVEAGLLRYLRQHKLSESILHIDTPPWQSWVFFTLLSLRGANVFVTLHNAITGARWREIIWKLRMRFVTRLPGFNLLTSNKDTRERIRHWANAEFWNRIPVTYTCVDPLQIEQVRARYIDRDSLKTKLGIVADDLVILCVGQFIDRKGRWDLIEAARRFSPESPGIKFIWLTPLAPSEADQQRLEAEATRNFQLVLSSTVGRSREEVLSFFRIADIFALPSYVEGLPIALLEAMALGIPAISTNVYAIPEAIFDDRTGLLIEPGDPGALADAIRRLASDSTLRERLARDGQELVLRNFDERVASRIAIDAYNRSFADDSGHN